MLQLDDDLLIILMFPDVYELSWVDFINESEVMGFNFCVGEAEEDLRDVFPVLSRGGWITPAPLKRPPESSTFLHHVLTKRDAATCDKGYLFHVNQSFCPN